MKCSVLSTKTVITSSNNTYTYQQATTYAHQHIWWLSQARINWEGCARKGIWCKNDAMAEVVAPISLDGVHPDCWCVCLRYLHCAPTNPEDGDKDNDFSVSHVGVLTCLHKQEVGKTSQNEAQPCARVQGYVNDNLRADGLWKGWGFWVSTWNVNKIGRAGKVVEA